MEPGYVIALDTHRAFTEVVVMTATGRVRLRRRVVTALPELRSLIEEVRRPRHVVLEEGPLADWLLRGLEGVADVVTACDPRRNAHIAKDGDKDDPIDAEKLGHLYRGGFINPVHHPATLERAAFKQLVGLYHERVRNLVRHGQRIAAQFGQHGVFVRQPVFTHWAEREALLGHLPSPSLRVGVGMLLEEFDLARSRVLALQQILAREGRRFEPVRRFVAVPGVKWVRAGTFFAYVDTPWRFASKAALWRYMGIGLERRHSGEGPVSLRVPPAYRICRPLNNMILGTAQLVITARVAPFAQRYEEYRHAGLSPRTARRSVARCLAATLWGMFKNGRVYHPEWVGVALAAGLPEGESAAAG
jgi:transposase